jgi:hypothetical protein
MTRLSDVLLWVAMAWALGNSAYVYLVRGGLEGYRVESAVFALVILAVPRLLVARGRDAAIATTPPAEPVQSDRLIIVATTLLWVGVLLPVMRLPFFSDDYGFLDAYRSLGDVMRRIQFVRPTFALVYIAVAHLGSSPVVFHVISLAGHLSAALLVYSIVRRLPLAPYQPVLCFVAFLLNPVQLGTVIWPAAVMDILWTNFALGAVCCYIGQQTLTPVRLAATLALVTLALASKETAVCLFLLLPAADWLLFRSRRGPLLWVAYSLLAVELAGYLWVWRRFAVLDERVFVLPSQFFVKQFISTPYKVFAQPWAHGSVAVPTLVTWAIVTTLIALLFVRVRGAEPRRLLIGPVFILLTTLPVYAYFAVFPNLRNARYVYCASAGWALLVSELLVPVVNAQRKKVAAFALAASCAVLLAFNTRPWRQAGDLIAAMREDVQRGGDGRAAAAAWQARTGQPLQMEDGIPVALEGVDVFRNGYREFVAFSRGELSRERVRP